jgi:hypothetical protein
MDDTMDLKIRQMHGALGGMTSQDVASLAPEVNRTATYTTIHLPGEGSEVDLANAASLLVANIACMKDHLKAWCTKNGREFKGENLINNNRSVALVHDLWNVDKHAELDKKPRSGFTPKLVNLRQAVRFSGTGPGRGGIGFNFETGQGYIRQEGGVKASVRISGDIVDESGQQVADFYKACEEAVDAWASELEAAGVALPPDKVG